MPHDNTAIANPLAGHIVRFPTAIPTEQWMADRMLWADRIGAVWPFDSQPTPSSPAEEAALSAVLTYQEAGFFTECQVPTSAFDDGAAAALGMTPRQLRDWATLLPAGDDQDPVETFRAPRDAYFYINKLGPEVSNALVSVGIAIRTDGHFIRLKSPKAARRLIATIAASALPTGDGDLPMTLDAANDEDLAAAAAPAHGDVTYAAKVVNLPVVTTARATDPSRIIDFRTKSRNERARKDYLAAVEAHVSNEVFVAGEEGRADQIRSEKIRRDLMSATEGLIEKHGAAELTVLGASAVSALVAIPQSAGGSVGAVSVAAGLTGMAASGVLLLRGARNTRYLRRGRAAGIFGGPPTLPA